MQFIVSLASVNATQHAQVGGKNASLGEMINHLSSQGINVPPGYAITVAAFEKFLTENHLNEKIESLLQAIDIDNVTRLAKASASIKKLILNAPFSREFESDVATVLKTLKGRAVAVRSSALGEDLATASFAGQQESFLNVKGLKAVLQAIKLVYASPFNSRAISYRYHHGFDHNSCALSVGIQPMVRSDKSVSGVMFTLDTETGFDKVIIINAAYGLGEGIVQGKVNPDEFIVYKPTLEKNKFAILQRKLGDKAVKMIYTASMDPKKSIKAVSVRKKEQSVFSLTDKEIETLARYALKIEKHYQRPMDIEWAKDGIDGKLYILQARPETVKSGQTHGQVLEHYQLKEKAKVVVSGQSVGQKIGQGQAVVISDPTKIRNLGANKVLVTDMTDPDWEPIMKQAAAIVTNRGGRTCHAAIIARELGIPAIVGCGNATKLVKQHSPITVSCAEGQIGHVYAGLLNYDIQRVSIADMPPLPIKVGLNLGNPEKAFATQFLPNEGVGLARIEFIISNHIGVHPSALLRFKQLPKALQASIHKKTHAYKNPVEFYVEKLREGIATIAAAFYPKPVIFRFSDFKSNEYANLLGGNLFEPHEENPMLGFRGASRYTDKKFIDCFELECEAIKRVRNDMGLSNAKVMVPFVRTVSELKAVIQLLEKNGLKRTKDLQIYMMCEIPSNAILAKDYLRYVDGFSIGSNDLTQLTLGLDRDSNLVAELFDERDLAVKALLKQAIETCRAEHKYVGICGQGPSDYPDFAQWLMEQGIDAISINPDTIVETWLMLAKKLQQKPAAQITNASQRDVKEEMTLVATINPLLAKD